MNQTPKIPMTDSPGVAEKILNIGCGRNKMPGAVNLDIAPGADVYFDLEGCESDRMPFDDSYFDRIVASHTLEHIHNILPLMQELHRVAKPQAMLQIRVPFGGNSVAFEDPTHVRQFWPKSFEYFGQMAYNVADYGYRGDWEVEDMLLSVDDQYCDMPSDELAYMIERAFNIAKEIFVVMRAIKPVRKPDGAPRALKVKIGFEGDIRRGLQAAEQELAKGANDATFNQ